MPQVLSPESVGASRGLPMDTAELLHVFLNHAGTLSPFTLARLVACSKDFHRVTELHIKAAADIIISDAASQTKQSASELTKTLHKDALGWLCRTAGQAVLTAPGLGSRLVSIPNPAHCMIVALADAGVRVPFDQLVDAAKAHVPGCEEWGKSVYIWCEHEGANKRVSVIDVPLDMQPQLERLLQDVCAGLLSISTEDGIAVQHLHEVHPQHVVGLLHIALNIRVSNNCATELLKWLLQDSQGAHAFTADLLEQTWQQHATALEQLQQHVGQPDVLRQLLETALVRQLVEASTLLCRMPAIHQLSNQDVSGLMALIFTTCSSDLHSTRESLYGIHLDRLLIVVCQHLPTAKLPVAGVVQVIFKALDSGLYGPVQINTVARLLPVLCQQLPAVQQMQVSHVADILLKVVDTCLDSPHSTLFVTALLAFACQQVPAAQQLAVSQVEDILSRVVIRLSDSPYHIRLLTDLLTVFCQQIPAAQQLPVSLVANMLSKAFDSNKDSSRKDSCLARLLTVVCEQVPAAQHLPVSDVADIFSMAIDKSQDNPGGIGALTAQLPDLCGQLPAVQELQVSHVADIFTQAINKGLQQPGRISLLTTLLAVMCEHVPAAQQLPEAYVVDMIITVIKHPYHHDLWYGNKNELLLVLAALPAAQDISEETAASILQLCLQQRVPLLFVWQPMQQLGVASVQRLLLEAVDWYRLTESMLELPAIQQLSSDGVEQLLLAALAREDCESVCMVCCQHALAGVLSPSAVGRLLAAAVQLTHSSAPALGCILSLLRRVTVTIGELVPAIRAAVAHYDSRYFCTIISTLYAIMPYVAARYVVPEALRMAVLLRLPQRPLLWHLRDCGQHAKQGDVAAAAVCAVLSGDPAVLQQLLGFVRGYGPSKLWQQLLGLATLLQDQDAAVILAGKCFGQWQLHEPWLPDYERLAAVAGSAGYGGHSLGEVQSTTPVCQVAAEPGAAQNLAKLQQDAQQPQSHKSVSQMQGVLQPQEPGLQQVLQLQAHEQKVLDEQCLQEVASLMAAATRGTAATMFMGGWGSCFDTHTGSPTVVAASALQLLRSRRYPHALQLLSISLECMEASEDRKTAAGWLTELLQLAVVASNADACGLLCSQQLCQHSSLQRVMNVLILAVQMLHTSSSQQRQQRMLVMQHVGKLFSSLAVASVQADSASNPSSSCSSSNAMATRACVRQVLASAVQLDAEEALQELLVIIPVQEGLLAPSHLYTLLGSLLRHYCNPRVMQMLCGLRLSWHFDETQPQMPVSPSQLQHLFHMTLALHQNQQGVSEIIQLLAAWDPRPVGLEGSYVGTTPRLSDSALDDMCGQAYGMWMPGERSLVLKVLCSLYSQQS